nr:unnamed protein product [Digitaria exilis]
MAKPKLPTLLLVTVFIIIVLASNSDSARPKDAELRTLLTIMRDWGNPTALSSWNSQNTSYCKWQGVSCNNGRVAKLSFQLFYITNPIPASICSLKNLTYLDISYNNLTGEFPAAALNACSALHYLDLSNNMFSGVLPADINKLPPGMEHLNLSSNGFSGSVPLTIAGFPKLKSLLLDTNSFNGSYPGAAIGYLTELETLTLASNPFSPGPIPDDFARLKNLKMLWMSEMNLTGVIPNKLSSLTELTLLALYENNLEGAIPAWVWKLPKLEILYLYANSFTGGIGHHLTAFNLQQIDLSTNLLTGPIPEAICDMKNLTVLYLYYNFFTGMIPPSIVLLPNLEDIKLFDNRLVGPLPPELGKHSPLGNLEVSNNFLTGELPETLCFKKKLYDIVVFNNSFSGEFPAILGECVTLKNILAYNNNFTGVFPELIIFSVSITSFAVVSFAAVCVGWDIYRRKKNRRDVLTSWKVTPFRALDFTGHDIFSNIREENLIGRGGSGKVYLIHLGSKKVAGKGRDEAAGRSTVAVKQIGNAGKPDGSLEKEFQAEVAALGGLRHGNIIDLLCCVSGDDTKLLVYEYMENGSLDRWLHRRRNKHGPLSWPTRLSIAVDVARGLSYMHHGFTRLVIHRDVKCSNILLDSGFRAKIADFGLARILATAGGESEPASAVCGTFGYIAPEYVSRARVSEKVDVYSFGVVLLELATGRGPQDGGTESGSCLAKWASKRYKGGGLCAADMVDGEIQDTAYVDDMVAVLELGVICTGEDPASRPAMSEVLRRLLQCGRSHGVVVDDHSDKDVCGVDVDSLEGMLDINWGFSQESDVSMVSSKGDTVTSSSSTQFTSAPPSMFTLHKHGHEKLAVEAEIVASGENTAAATLTATVSEDIIPISLAAVLDVMDSDDNDDLPMPTIMESTITKEQVQVAIPVVVATPTLETDPSYINIEVSANYLMRFLEFNFSKYVHVDGLETILIPTNLDRSTLRLLMSSLSVSLHVNQSAHHVSETALSIQWVEKQPWPPPTQLEPT